MLQMWWKGSCVGLALAALPLHAQDALDAMPDDVEAVAADEEEDVVETVRLGGEDRVTDQIQGVQQDDQTVSPMLDPSSPLRVDTSQEPLPVPGVGEGKPIEISNDPSVHDPSRVAFASTRPNARTMSLTIPAPRGLITDREGRVYACSEVAYQPSIIYRQVGSAEASSKDASDEEIVAIGRKVMADFEAAGFKVSEKTDQQLISHYKDRRWLPLPIGPIVRESELTKKKREGWRAWRMACS